MIVRPAVSGDAAAIAAIQNPIIRDTAITFNAVEKTEDDIIRSIAIVPCFRVAEEAGQILGFASYAQFRNGVGYGRTMEHTIVLAPDSRGRGIGRALMDELCTHATDNGVGSLWAGVSGENPSGVAFHAKIGFEEIARLPKVGYKFGRWIDLVLMRKWLGDVGADSA